MSKILRALSDVKELRKNKHTFLMNDTVQTTPESSLSAENGHTDMNGHRFFKWNSPWLLVTVFIFLVGLLTYVNYSMMVQLQKMRATTLQITKGISGYDSKLKQLEKGLNNLSLTNSAMTKMFNGQMKSIQMDYKKLVSEIEDVSIDTNLLRLKIKELDVTNQKLMDSYINLNNEVRQLGEANSVHTQ